MDCRYIREARVAEAEWVIQDNVGKEGRGQMGWGLAVYDEDFRHTWRGTTRGLWEAGVNAPCMLAAEREGRLLQYPGEKMVTAHATVLWWQMEVKSAQVGRVLCVVLCEVSQTGFLCMCVSQTGFLPLPLLMMQSVWVCVCVCVKGRNGCDWT